MLIKSDAENLQNLKINVKKIKNSPKKVYKEDMLNQNS